MSATIPDSHRDLLEGKAAFAVLTTMMPDDQPQSSVVWIDVEGNNVLVNTAQGRQKARNMEERPRVSVVVIDPDNPYRYLEVRGQVTEITEQGAAAHIDKMARKYTGAPEYYGHAAPAEAKGKEQRVICRIAPTRVLAFG